MCLKTDLHCHTEFSYDSRANPEDVVRAALEKGVAVLAITDHYDVDYADCGMKMEMDFALRKKTILSLKEKYRGKIKVIFGIELGQPYNYPEISQKIVLENGFEFVIGSVHSLKGVPDFYYLDYSKMDDQGMIENLYERYLRDLYKLTGVPYIDTIAHITYPVRYIRDSGKELDIEKYFPEYRRIFESAVANDKMIEINTSEIRKGVNFGAAEKQLFSLYREAGGRYVTVGADAHNAVHVACDFEEAEKLAQCCGLEIFRDVKEKY